MGENQHTEWKSAWRDEYLKWLCAFANSQGGVLEIGKDDSGRVVGVPNAQQLLVELPNKVRDLLGIVVDVDLVHSHGCECVRILVEPYPHPISYRGEYHVRSGSTKQVLRGAALDRFLLTRTGRRWDAVPIPNVNVDALDRIALDGFRKRAAKSSRISASALEENDSVLVEKLRLLDGPMLKRAAILLFHPDPEQFVAGATVRIGYFGSDSDLLFHDIVEGPLFTQIDRAMDLLRTKYFKAFVRYDGMQRIELSPIPVDALREALLNALAHKDYSGNVPIQISVYDDRVMFWNYGRLPENWTTEQLTSKHPSHPYNPDIANALFLAGMIEAWGRGIPAMVQSCRGHGLPPPSIRCDDTGIWVEFRFASSPGTKSGLSREQAVVIRKCIEPSGIRDLMAAAHRRNRSKFRDQVLAPLMNEGIIEMTHPNKPTSSKQRYRLSVQGRALAEKLSLHDTEEASRHEQ